MTHPWGTSMSKQLYILFGLFHFIFQVIHVKYDVISVIIVCRSVY